MVSDITEMAKMLREQREKTKTLMGVSRGHETKLQIVKPTILSGQKVNIKFSAHLHFRTFYISHTFYIIQNAALDPKYELQIL